MIHSPHDFPRHLYVSAYQARRQEEAALRNMHVIDKIAAPFCNPFMDALLALFLGLVAGGFIWLAVL